jgi:hypothetical protein
MVGGGVAALGGEGENKVHPSSPRKKPCKDDGKTSKMEVVGFKNILALIDTYSSNPCNILIT